MCPVDPTEFHLAEKEEGSPSTAHLADHAEQQPVLLELRPEQAQHPPSARASADWAAGMPSNPQGRRPAGQSNEPAELPRRPLRT